jgi:hypothetical protein
MTKMSFTLLPLTFAACFTLLGCQTQSSDQTTTRRRWCSYAVAASSCEQIRKDDTVCFVCEGAANCRDRRKQTVKVGYKGHECKITLGKQLSETCADCKEGKKVVELK